MITQHSITVKHDDGLRTNDYLSRCRTIPIPIIKIIVRNVEDTMAKRSDRARANRLHATACTGRIDQMHRVSLRAEAIICTQ